MHRLPRKYSPLFLSLRKPRLSTGKERWRRGEAASRSHAPLIRNLRARWLSDTGQTPTMKNKKLWGISLRIIIRACVCMRGDTDVLISSLRLCVSYLEDEDFLPAGKVNGFHEQQYQGWFLPIRDCLGLFYNLVRCPAAYIDIILAIIVPHTC